MQFTSPKVYIKDAQATGEAFSPQKPHPALENLKFLPCFLFLWVIFALLDPDPADQNQCGSMQIWIRNAVLNIDK